MSLDKLCQLVSTGKTDESTALAEKLIGEGVDALEIISTLTDAMGEVGERFSRLEIFLPEMMLAGDAMGAAVDTCRSRLLEGEALKTKGKVILGTVKGDLHEIGKNIVKLMLEANGFEVKDLGYDVDSLAFIKAAQEMDADIIAASSLMSTTLPHQKEIISIANLLDVDECTMIQMMGGVDKPTYHLIHCRENVKHMLRLDTEKK